MNYSVTFIGLVGSVLYLFLTGAEIAVSEADVGTFLKVLLGIVSALTVYIGRYRQGDVSILGVKE